MYFNSKELKCIKCENIHLRREVSLELKCEQIQGFFRYKVDMETKEKMKTDFLRFLKDNDAYIEFTHECIEQDMLRVFDALFNWLYKEKKIHSVINYMVRWYSTRKGVQYYENLNKLWYEEYRRKYV